MSTILLFLPYNLWWLEIRKSASLFLSNHFQLLQKIGWSVWVVEWLTRVPCGGLFKSQSGQIFLVLPWFFNIYSSKLTAVRCWYKLRQLVIHFGVIPQAWRKLLG